MYRFPKGMRIATLEERKEFYAEEFDIESVARWLSGKRGHVKFAMIPGRHTGLVAPWHAKEKDDVVLIDTWKSVSDIKDWALEYLPEGLYYDRNRYRDVFECVGCSKGPKSCQTCHNYEGQQLAFDLDPENVDCPYHGHIGDKLRRGRGLSFCMYEFKRVRKEAALLAEELRGEYNRVTVVFSGRGFHVIVEDEAAYAFSSEERRRIAKRFERRYPIDEWVTEGSSRLMRLPFSLNALVSRKCIIMKNGKDFLEFDPRVSESVLPAFLRLS